MASGEIRYTPPDGTPELKKAIIRYTEEFYGWRPAPENVMASGGAKQAIMSALHTILDPQEEVIFPCPYWVSYPDMARLVGAIGVYVPNAAGADFGSDEPTRYHIIDAYLVSAFFTARSLRNPPADSIRRRSTISP